MLLEWNIGEWYFAVRCKSCDLQFAFEPDPTHNRERFNLLHDQRCFTAKCPDCCGVNCYLADEVRSVQAL